MTLPTIQFIIEREFDNEYRDARMPVAVARMLARISSLASNVRQVTCRCGDAVWRYRVGSLVEEPLDNPLGPV